MSDEKEQSTNVFSVITGIVIVYFVIKFCFFSSGTESNFIDSIFGSDFGTKSSLLQSFTKGCKKEKGQYYDDYYCDNMNYKWDTVRYWKKLSSYRGEDTIYEKFELCYNKGERTLAIIEAGNHFNGSYDYRNFIYKEGYKEGYAFVMVNPYRNSAKVFYMPEKDVFDFLNGTNR